MAIANIHQITHDDAIRTHTDHNSQKNTEKIISAIEKIKIPDQQKKESSLEIQNDEMYNRRTANAIDKLSQTIQIYNKRIKMSVHEETKRIIIKIIDRKTNKVIKEIPNRDVLNFIEKLHDILGVLIDKKQ